MKAVEQKEFMVKQIVTFLKLWHHNRKNNPYKSGEEITKMTLNNENRRYIQTSS